MEKCKLCLKNDADDTGSHIVPHFLLKRIFNVANAKGRDQEISFKLTAFDIESHFGRSVQPEKLEEVFGELTDEELEKKAMADLVVNHEWCKACEKKFADLESFYSKTLEIDQQEPYQSTRDALGAMMFWLSILWRTSVTDNTSFQLSDKDERKIRTLLNEYQPGQSNEEFIAKFAHILDEIHYKVYRSPDYYKKVGHSMGTFLYMGKQRQPYTFIVDEFVVMVYLKTKHLKEHQQMFFGLEKLEAEPNNYLNGEFVYPLNVADFSVYMERFVESIKQLRLRAYNNNLDKLYRKIGHKGTLPEHIRAEVLAQITKDETRLGRKYTYADFVKCTTEVFLKHHLELRQIKR